MRVDLDKVSIRELNQALHDHNGSDERYCLVGDEHKGKNMRSPLVLMHRLKSRLTGTWVTTAPV